MHGKINNLVDENLTSDSLTLDNKSTGNTLGNNPDFNMGQVLERVIRRDHMGISELARRLDVSRRTIYNWFRMETLNLDVIHKIGLVLGHDFTNEFPHIFARKLHSKNDDHGENKLDTTQQDDAIYYWMNRYIKLLEKYNEILSQKQNVI